ncbi:DUF6214 family protein [Streptomyces kronopolitis]
MAVPAAADTADGTLPDEPDAGHAGGTATRPVSDPRPLSPQQPAPSQQLLDGPLPERTPDTVGAGAGEGPAPTVTEAAPVEAPARATGAVTGEGAADPTTTGIGTGATASADTSADTPSDTSAEPPCDTTAEPSTAPPAGAPAEPSSVPARSALLSRSRSGARRRIAADAYRQAQRDGHDPVLAVMQATGRNRRRSLRLIAGARDEGLLAPRHNKR